MQQLLLELESDSSSSGKKRNLKKGLIIPASSSSDEEIRQPQKSPQARPSNLKTSIEQLEKATIPDSIGKRVKFNKFIEQIDFLKQAVVFDEGKGAKQREQESS